MLISASVFYASSKVSAELAGVKSFTGSIGGNAAGTKAVQAGAATKGRIDFGTSSFLGSPNAPYVIIDFSDFQCPFCKKFFDETKNDVVKNLVDSGKARFMYKHFPLDSIHPNARPAAIAFECAKVQGKPWEFHDALFANQNSLSNALYSRLASSLGLDLTAFNSCSGNSAAANAVVESDLQQGIANGITGTPGFLITDAQGNVVTLISGAQPYSAFKRAFDALPAK